MTNDFTPPQSQEEIPPVVSAAPVPPAPAKNSNKQILLLGGAAILIFCLCSIACAVVAGVVLFSVNQEKAPVESILTDYMYAMVAKDADRAYALFSPRAQRQIPLSQIQEQFEGNNFLLYEGFLKLSVANINISAAANTNPDQPQGTVATVDGVIYYAGDIQGTFKSTLEKVNDAWMIDAMFVNIPLEKIK